MLTFAASAAIFPHEVVRAQSKSSGRAFRIIDAQVHIWSGGKPSPAQWQQVVTKERILAEMAEAGVERAVIVPVSWDPEGNKPALQAAQQHPDRFAVMGLASLDEAKSKALLESWKKQQGMLGVRLFLASPKAAAAVKDGSANWFWAEAERTDLAVMAHAGGMLKEIGIIARRHPRLRLCIDSLGAPPRTRDAAAFAHLPDLLALAKLPNVVVKAEGVPTQSSEPYPYRNLHPYLRQAYDAFGPQRLFWGSDVTRLKTPYKQSVTLFTEELSWLSSADLEFVMGGAVSNWLGWPLS